MQPLIARLLIGLASIGYPGDDAGDLTSSFHYETRLEESPPVGDVYMTRDLGRLPVWIDGGRPPWVEAFFIRGNVFVRAKGSVAEVARLVSFLDEQILRAIQATGVAVPEVPAPRVVLECELPEQG